MQKASNANSMFIFCALFYKLMNSDLDTFYTTDQSKRPKIDGNRSNRKKVQYLRCDKVVNADNTKYYARSKHPDWLHLYLRTDICVRGQTLLNFKVDSRDIQVNKIVI